MKHKLVCFDFDGTLIEDTCAWQVLHDFYQTDKVARSRCMDDFFSGKITYKQWFDHDISAFMDKGCTRESLVKSIEHVRLMRGARETLDELKRRGYRLAVISGSLSFVVEKFFDDYFDYVFVNRLVFDKDGRLIGGEATPFDMEHKATGLKMICEKEGISPSQCVFVGDHFNDVEIAKIAGLAISFNSKVKALDDVADVVIKKKDLREILKHV